MVPVRRARGPYRLAPAPRTLEDVTRSEIPVGSIVVRPDSSQRPDRAPAVLEPAKTTVVVVPEDGPSEHVAHQERNRS